MGNIWNILFSVGLAQGLFLLFLILFAKKPRKKTVFILAGLLFCYVSLLFFEWINAVFTAETAIIFHRVGETIPLLIGPLFLLHTKSIIEPNFKFEKLLVFHFLPFIAFFIIFTPFYLQPSELKLEYLFWRRENGIPLEVAIFSSFKGLHTFIYLILSWRSIKTVKKKNNTNSEKYFKFKILKNLINFNISMTVLVYFIVIIQYFNHSFFIDADKTAGLLISFSFYIYAFVIVCSPETIFFETDLKFNRQKYQTSSLINSDKQIILANTKELMKSRKPFLNADLTINELAKIVDVKPNQLSQIINEMEGKNFNQFINEYRIEEVKRNIHKKDKTLLEIAFESGFNTKSAFNRIFKDFTGMTPSEYKKNLKNKS